MEHTKRTWEWGTAQSPMFGAVTELWSVSPTDDTDMELVMWPRVTTAEGVMYLELEFAGGGEKELIAAAPDMLEALRGIVVNSQDFANIDLDISRRRLEAVWESARAAISLTE